MSIEAFIAARDRLSYDPETGSLRWRDGPKAGRVAGTVGVSGYRRVCINGKQLRAHRIAWFIYHGAMPNDQVDHVNRNRDDNRISNLRDVSNAENQRNRGSWAR